jgi:PAS domain S-box-containing protein
MKHIGTKLLILISGTFLLISSFLLYRTYHVSKYYVDEIVKQQADLTLQFNISIRQYVEDKIRPVMYEQLGENKFIPETMSTSFIARTIFTDVQRKFPNAILKYACKNPRNPSNQAGPEELKIIRYFNSNPYRQTWYGKTNFNGESYFTKFNARRMKETCLRCHGDPKDAPTSMIERYGSTAGFFWPREGVVALDTVAIPVSKVQAQLSNEIRNNFTITGMALLLLIFSLFFTVQRLVSNRLNAITKHFSVAASSGDYSRLSRLKVQGSDEISVLAQSYNTLVEKLQRYHNSLYSEKERLNVTLRSIGDGVITTDLDGKIVLINKITEQLTGWNQEEAFGRPVQDVFNIINEETGIPCENPVDRVLASGKIIDMADHTALIARNGTQYIIEDSGAPIFDNQCKMIGTVLVFRDVTVAKKTAGELLKVKKLESVGGLAGGIAHDFNNILAAILGNIELAELTISSTEEAYPLLQEAKKASIRARTLTQQLLTFSSGGDPVKKTAPIGKGIIESATFALHGSSVSCRFNIPNDLWLVEIDSGQISQVIQNLVINAKQAMPDGGKIEIDCANIADIKSEQNLDLPNKTYIKITIQDNGCGVAEEYIEKIFDPYFTTKIEGCGLGLSIAHSIINKHDGHIEVTSGIGKGTTFTIYLPASEQQNIHGTTPKKPNFKKAKAKAKAKILVMDDDKRIREVAKQMLTRLGHEVLLACEGNEAVTIFSELCKSDKPVDVIIMDLTIPGGMGGKEAIKEILKIDPEAKVVVASGYSNDPVMSNYQQYGFKVSIAKPFMLKELRRTLTDILS